MGREVRMVTEGYEHPKQRNGLYEPLLDGYQDDLKGFEEKIKEVGLRKALDYYGGGPVSDDYMLPDCDPKTRTWYMMFENVSEGTPISPAFETPEELAQWLEDSKADTFGSNSPATYEQWLYVCKGGYAPTAVVSSSGVLSGVQASEELHNKD